MAQRLLSNWLLSGWLSKVHSLVSAQSLTSSKLLATCGRLLAIARGIACCMVFLMTDSHVWFHLINIFSITDQMKHWCQNVADLPGDFLQPSAMTQKSLVSDRLQVLQWVDKNFHNCANILMAKLEEEVLSKCPKQPRFYFFIQEKISTSSFKFWTPIIPISH